MASEVSIRVRLEDEEDYEAAKAAATLSDVELEEPPRREVVEPVSAVLIGGAVLAIGKFVMDWWERRQERKRGGLVVDLRKEATDNLYRDVDVPFGFVVNLMTDGKVTIEVKDTPKDATERLLGEIVSGAFGTVKALAEAAAEVVGEGKVSTEPAAQE